MYLQRDNGGKRLDQVEAAIHMAAHGEKPLAANSLGSTHAVEKREKGVAADCDSGRQFNDIASWVKGFCELHRNWNKKLFRDRVALLQAREDLLEVRVRHRTTIRN
jgi:hypothetical protein